MIQQLEREAAAIEVVRRYARARSMAEPDTIAACRTAQHAIIAGHSSHRAIGRGKAIIHKRRRET